MAMHMRYQTTPGGGFTTVNLTTAAVAQVKITVDYNHPTAMNWVMYAAHHTFPLGIRNFVQFWDDAGDNPYTGGTQSSAAPLYEGFIEDVKPGDESNIVNYSALDPTRRISVEVPLMNAGYLAGSPPTPFPGASPRLVFNVSIEEDADYTFSILQWATMGQIIRWILDNHAEALAYWNAGPSAGIAYVPSDISSMSYIPQEKQVFDSEGLRPAIERMMRQWEPSARMLWYPGSRKWRFGDISTSQETTLTINDFSGDYKLLSLHLDRSLDQRSTAQKIYGPEKAVEVNLLWSDGGLTEIVSGEFLQNDIATCCNVPLLNRFQITDPLLRKILRRLQLPVQVQTGDFNIITVNEAVLLAHYPDNTRAGFAGWRVLPNSIVGYDSRTGVITIYSTLGAARYNANPNGGEPNYENPDDVKLIYATYGDPITVRWPLTGYDGTAYDVANVQTVGTRRDEMLAVGYEFGQPVTTVMRMAQFRTLARRLHNQSKDIIYVGTAVLEGLLYEFATLDRRINFDGVDADGDPVVTGFEAIGAMLTSVEFDFANQTTTLQFSSNQMELMGIDIEHQKRVLGIKALERRDWTYVSFGTNIRQRTISDKAGGFSNMTTIHDTWVQIDQGHMYVDPETGVQG